MAVRQGRIKRESVVTSHKAVRSDGAKAPVNIFVSYSHKDTSSREKLETHLAALKREGVTTWFDGDLNAGDTLNTNIARELRQAQIFVALLSPDYLASNYCWNLEFDRAMSRRSRGLVHVIAVVVKPCDWKATRAARFKLLPTDGKPVTAWRPADKAYLDIAAGIRRVVEAVRRDASSPASKRPGTKSTNATKLLATSATTAKPKVVKQKSKIAASSTRAPTKSRSRVKPKI